MAPFRPFRSLPFLAFVALSLVNVGSLLLAEPGTWLQMGSKALLMPALIWLVWGMRTDIYRFSWLLSALVLSWLGDLLLMLPGPMWFVLGLSSFLLAHLAYVRLFWPKAGTGIILRRKPWLALPFVLAAAALVAWLWPGLGDMRVPVLVYGLVISCMALAATARHGHVSPQSFALVLTGASFFMISDGLIAVSRFSAIDLPAAGAWVMVTYCLAQGLIVVGVLRDGVVQPHSELV